MKKSMDSQSTLRTDTTVPEPRAIREATLLVVTTQLMAAAPMETTYRQMVITTSIITTTIVAIMEATMEAEADQGMMTSCLGRKCFPGKDAGVFHDQHTKMSLGYFHGAVWAFHRCTSE